MQNLELESLYLRLVGGRSESEIRFSSRDTATKECDRLQFELNQDGEPGRWFVFDRSGVPIIAGGEHPANRQQSQKRSSWR